ncbi:hypothetical protein LTR39_001690, partial [Cryomyces antarcticus]
EGGDEEGGFGYKGERGRVLLDGENGCPRDETRSGKGKRQAASPSTSLCNTIFTSKSIFTTRNFIMFTATLGTFFVAVKVLLFLTGSSPASAAPFSNMAPPNTSVSGPGSSDYWVGNIQRQGTVAFSSNSNFQVYRNVKDFGAKGDGSTDDTAAINSAITAGHRCGQGCDSSTVTPALVYFPSGTYLVSKPIVQLYYTQFVGDVLNLPTIKASAGFQGIAVIDSDPYADGGVNWYTNQNNFFRQIRNFVIDLTAMPPTAGAGIHWQVAQATSLQNIRFEMVKGGSNNAQLGIFMDNGSGGFMTDLTFNGGNYGAFLGNQQFTTRNLTFNGCNTAIFMNWNWAWTFKSVFINNCKVGLDMANNPPNQTVGSVLLLDSKITGTPIGVNSSFSSTSVPETGGTLILDNVDFTGCATAVQSSSGSTILAGGSVVNSWGQGREYKGASGSRVQGPLAATSKPTSLLTSSGTVFERARPQYESYPASSFVSVKSKGAKGDCTTDDTQAVQAAINSLGGDQILYFDHGAYIITSTVKVPAGVKMTGEIWPLIMASGSFFGDQSNPRPVFQIGQPGDSGSVEMSDLMFETAGSAPGAIMMEWNLNSPTQGASGLWDVHFRIGGSAGTQLQSDKCAKNPDSTTVNTACEGAFLLFHATKAASNVYLENTWFWVADHELDLADHNQIDIYNGPGVLIESQGPVWLYGTSSEHSVLYNYQLNAAKDVWMGMIQTETPYFQANPAAPTPFTPCATYADPEFHDGNPTGNKAWGLRIVNSNNVLVYGAGLYSFFDNYAQTCLLTESCQSNMVDIEGGSNISLFGLSTKAAVNMVTVNGNGVVKDADNRSNFCATVALWTEG